jgi:Kef-type K+ transport system membrane component KefB
MNTILISVGIITLLNVMFLLAQMTAIRKRGNGIIWEAVIYRLIFWAIIGAAIGWTVDFIYRWF